MSVASWLFLVAMALVAVAGWVVRARSAEDSRAYRFGVGMVCFGGAGIGSHLLNQSGVWG